MRLISCYVENFGKLSETGFIWEDGLNTICRENGWGKSTLMAFVKCMFYGLSGDQKRTLESERKRYTPWQGGVFGGRLRFECEGKMYEVRRTWGKKASEDTCEVVDTTTNLPTDRFTVAVSGNEGSLGRQLFGIDEDSFARSAFVAQGDVLGTVTSDINAKISNLADNTNDMGNYELAMDYFKDALNALSEKRTTGKIYGEKTEAMGLNSDIMEETSIEESAQELRIKIDEIEESLSSLNSANKQLSEEMDKLSQWQDDQIKIEKYKLYDKAMCEAKADYDQTEKEAHVLKNKDADAPKKSGLGIAGIVLVVLGIGAMVVNTTMHPENEMVFYTVGIVLLVIGLVFIIIGSIINSKAKKENAVNHDAYVAAKAKHDKALEAYNVAKAKVDEYIAQYGTRFLDANDYMGFTDGSGREFSTGVQMSDEIQANNQRIDELKKTRTEYTNQLEEKQERLDEIKEKKTRLVELNESIAEDQNRVRRMELARDILTDAKNRVTARYIEPLTNGFAHYYDLITGSSSEAYVIDAESKITVDEKGKQRDTNILSTGLQDAVGFAMRMALIDAMYTEEKPPVIIDDAFSNMDDANLAGAMKVLGEIAQKYQILYFTCHGAV